MNQSAMEFIRAQAGEQEAIRIEQFVNYAPIKKVALNALAVDLRFDPEEALKVKAQGNFTNQQLALLRTIGVHLPNFYDLKDEEEKLVFPSELIKATLAVGKLKPGEVWKEKKWK